ncbi:MAG: hypothetical protein RSD36_17875 [Terrisporobacter sp.]
MCEILKYEVFDVNNDFSKEELLESKNVTAAIFLLDQKIDAIEFLQRIKAIALFFDSLTNTEIKAIKHWIKNTVEERLAESAIKILESKKEDVEFMVANNAFIISEMKEKAIQEGIEKGIQKGIQKGKIISKREDIIENLYELGEVSEKILDLINSEESLDTLKKWLKLSIKCESIEEFMNSIVI